MKLDVSGWKPFRLGALIDDIYKAKAHAKIELTASLSKRDGYIPFVFRTEANNGVDCYVLEKEVKNIESGNAIVIGDTTATISYQANPFVTGDHIIVIRAQWLNQYAAMFIVSLLQRERFRYCYGRAYLKDSIENTCLLLPVIHDDKGAVIIDKETDFSEEGYVPDWEWMETYIKSLHFKPLTTRINRQKTLPLTTGNWKEFYLHRIMDAGMGNGIDAVITTSDHPKYNYVTRESNGNGVGGFVDEIEGEEAFPAGAMSLALGGSLGACFIQRKPFYTAQNVAVLQEKEPLSDYTKLFLATLIRNECKIKYQAFGRELNAHFRKDFTLKLPVCAMEMRRYLTKLVNSRMRDMSRTGNGWKTILNHCRTAIGFRDNTYLPQ